MTVPGFSAEASRDRAVARYRTARRVGQGGGQVVTPQGSNCDQYMTKAVAYATLASQALDQGDIPTALDHLDTMEAWGAVWEACVALQNTLPT